jgi:tRNA (cmo5U34)-methyltransferase
MDPKWAAGIEGQFDAVVSSIAIHNVRFPDRIRGIYGELFPLVSPGGVFLNFDQVAYDGSLSERAERQAQMMQRRRRLHEETGRWQALDEVAGQARWRGGHDHEHTNEEDRRRIASHEPATLSNQIKWLREAGFAEADCLHRDGRRVILAAFRAT